MKRLFGALIAMAVASSALASDKRDPIALQLEPVAVQIKLEGKRPTKINVTIFLEVATAEQVASVCERIRSFHEASALTSVELNKKKVDITYHILEKDIKNTVLRKFSPEKFHNIYIKAGHRQMGEGATVIQFEGTSPRCRALDRIPLDVLAYVRPKDGNAVPFEPARMLDGDYPLATATVGMPAPVGSGGGSPLLGFIVGIGLALAAVGGAAAGIIFTRKRRARKENTSPERRSGSERRGENRGAPSGSEKREPNDRRTGDDRRTRADRRGSDEEENE